MVIFTGMSGGIDSSVTAAILKGQSHNVTGVMMSLWDDSYTVNPGGGSCFSPEEKYRAEETQTVCDFLGIPFKELDCSADFKNHVLDKFTAEYISGRTPNPCVICNREIKFGSLMRAAEEQIGAFDKFATGHYARVIYNEKTGRYNLLRGIDPIKDQSYFLYRLTQSQLSKVIFPLGEFTKQQIREAARSLNLPIKQTKESQDFFNGNYRALVSAADAPGFIINTSGAVIGEHKGISNFTPGQRRGMGIGYSEPLYVVRLNPADNTVVAGTRDQLYSTEFTVTDFNLISVEKIESQAIAAVKIRSVGNESPCEVIQHDDMLTVKLLNPLAAVSPGQSAVFYDGDTVIGGGFIDKILR